MDFEPELEEAEAGAPEWMVTFADLMSLLLTFFVLLLSFSNMEIISFRTMSGSVKNALGLKSEFALSNTPMGKSLLPYQDPKEGEGGGEGKEKEQIRAELEKMLEDAGLKGRATVRQTARGVSLHIQGDLLFDSGSADLKQAAFSVLDWLASYLHRLHYYVDVQGHSDSVPISTSVFPSNWELSAARAGRTVRYLTDNGVPPRSLRAIGLSDTAPVDTNETAEGRVQNRRVEFIFARPWTVPRLDDPLQSDLAETETAIATATATETATETDKPSPNSSYRK